jgi:hypothetical protein
MVTVLSYGQSRSENALASTRCSIAAHLRQGMGRSNLGIGVWGLGFRVSVLHRSAPEARNEPL